MADQPAWARKAPCGNAGNFQHFETVARVEVDHRIARFVSSAAQQSCARDGPYHRHGIVWSEYVFGEANVGDIATDRVGAWVEVDRAARQRKARAGLVVERLKRERLRARWNQQGRGRRR